MYKLRIVQSGKQYDYEPGASLLEILLAQNIFIDNPCNGKGVCGKCKVRIVSGEAGEVSSTELRFLKPEEVKSGVRLSCMVHPQCDLEVELMQKERNHAIVLCPVRRCDQVDDGWLFRIDKLNSICCK